jgi:hypothetical protein
LQQRERDERDQQGAPREAPEKPQHALPCTSG